LTESTRSSSPLLQAVVEVALVFDQYVNVFDVYVSTDSNNLPPHSTPAVIDLDSGNGRRVDDRRASVLIGAKDLAHMVANKEFGAHITVSMAFVGRGEDLGYTRGDVGEVSRVTSRGVKRNGDGEERGERENKMVGKPHSRFRQVISQ
jgi:hypothetical protein